MCVGHTAPIPKTAIPSERPGNVSQRRLSLAAAITEPEHGAVLPAQQDRARDPQGGPPEGRAARLCVLHALARACSLER